MELFNSILTWVMKKRIHQIELFLKYPHDVQEEIAKKLLSKAKFTEFGKAYAFDDISSLDQFKERVPVSNYEQMFPYIERLMKGDQTWRHGSALSGWECWDRQWRPICCAPDFRCGVSTSGARR